MGWKRPMSLTELKFGLSSVGRYWTKAATGFLDVRFVTFPCTGILLKSLKSSLPGSTPGALIVPGTWVDKSCHR